MKQHLPLILPVACGVVLILSASLYEGVLTRRWGSRANEQLRAFARVLDVEVMDDGTERVNEDPEISGQIGVWQWQKESMDLDRRELNATGAVGHLSRRYLNPHTQETVSVYMICGYSRQVAVHNPKACYTTSGFRMEDKVRVCTIPYGNTTGEFRTAVFLKEDATSTQPLRVFWAWTADGNWDAPEWPRMKYGGRTPLNKVYFIARSTPGERIEDNPAYEFAKEYLPVVTPLLYPPPANEAKAAPAEGSTKTPGGAAGAASPKSPPAADDKKAAAAKKATVP
jgi:hypothetical protein